MDTKMRQVWDSNKPLSWSHILYPIVVAEERDDQQPVFLGTMAHNGILAEAPSQIFQNLLS
jgi:hypothetical protein